MARANQFRVMAVALGANVLIAAAKLIAAALLGSASMMSEAFHSVADCSNQALLMYGGYRAGKPPDTHHPFGYGREVYFWSFVVAMVIFALGAGLSLLEGIRRISDPTPPKGLIVSYIVFGIAFVAETRSWFTAVREFRKDKGKLGYVEAAHRSKDPQTLIGLCEDSAALIGIAIAATATALTQALGRPWIDGAGSIGVALVMAVEASFLSYEIRGLIIGEATDPEALSEIEKLLRRNPAIRHVNRLWSVHLGPSEVLVAASVDFADATSAREIEAAAAALQREIKRRHPQIRHFFLELKEFTGPDRRHAGGTATPIRPS